MKKIILLLLSPLFLLSCVDKTTEGTQYDLKKITSFEIRTLPIQEGLTTIAKLDGDTIAESDVAIPYFYPKNGEVTFEYYIPTIKAAKAPFSAMSTILCFEDLENGDDDYNDFICKMDVKYTYNTNGKYINNIELKVLPIAQGGSLILGFNISCPGGKNAALTTNVRLDFFNGITTFVNTEPNIPLYTNMVTHSQTITYSSNSLSVTGSNSYLIDPYITVQGREVHVVVTGTIPTIRYNQYVNTSGRPYGLAIPPKTKISNVYHYFRYPMEKINIRTAYPNAFQNWIDGTSTSFNYSNPVSDDVQTQANMITLLGPLVTK